MTSIFHISTWWSCGDFDLFEETLRLRSSIFQQARSKKHTEEIQDFLQEVAVSRRGDYFSYPRKAHNSSESKPSSPSSSTILSCHQIMKLSVPALFLAATTPQAADARLSTIRRGTVTHPWELEDLPALASTEAKSIDPLDMCNPDPRPLVDLSAAFQPIQKPVDVCPDDDGVTGVTNKASVSSVVCF